MKQTAQKLHRKIQELERKLMADINHNHKALFHRIPQKMHPTQRLANEILYLEDAINGAWELEWYDTVNMLADYLLQVRREYKLEMVKPV